MFSLSDDSLLAWAGGHGLDLCDKCFSFVYRWVGERVYEKGAMVMSLPSWVSGLSSYVWWLL